MSELVNKIELKADGLLGDLLVSLGHITEQDLSEALDLQGKSGGRIGANLVRLGALSDETLLSVLSHQLGIPVIDLKDLPDSSVINSFLQSTDINFDWFLSCQALLWRSEAGFLQCAARDPLNPALLDILENRFSDQRISFFLISNYAYEQAASALSIENKVAALYEDAADSKYLKELAEEAPVVDFVNNVLSQAVDVEASDIHVEPEELVFQIRFRTDGVLRDQISQSMERFPAVASRIKLIAGLDIAERRLPQDGRITIRVSGAELDLRVSTLPGVHGESIVLRLLPKNRESLSLDKLGLEEDHQDILLRWSRSSGGIVLVTGPTGSGKSTTLHGALAAANDGLRKIITVEDPVEIQVQGITQVQVHADIGYTFATALRAILRQDPDVIMIGEIRDLETAEIAIQSALSGHLVLSTLHTNDALSAFTRLIDMGVEPFLVAAPIKGVQAQRLVRRLCSECAVPSQPDQSVRQEIIKIEPAMLGDNWLEAKGCDACAGTGYKGRLGVYQLVEVDERMQEMIVSGQSLNELREEAVNKGYRTLLQDGLLKASHGKTSVAELMRVISSEDLG